MAGSSFYPQYYEGVLAREGSFTYYPPRVFSNGWQLTKRKIGEEVSYHIRAPRGREHLSTTKLDYRRALRYIRTKEREGMFA